MATWKAANPSAKQSEAMKGVRCSSLIFIIVVAHTFAYMLNLIIVLPSSAYIQLTNAYALSFSLVQCGKTLMRIPTEENPRRAGRKKNLHRLRLNPPAMLPFQAQTFDRRRCECSHSIYCKLVPHTRWNLLASGHCYCSSCCLVYPCSCSLSLLVFLGLFLWLSLLLDRLLFLHTNTFASAKALIRLV